MRYAVVVAPPRFVLPGGGSVFAAPEPVGPLCAAFSSGGRLVILVRTTPDLGEDFARAIAVIGTEDDLVVCIAAATSTRTAAVSLRVDDEAGGTLLVHMRLLGDAVHERRPASALFVIEACHDGDDDDDGMLASEHADRIIRALDARSRGFGAMVGVHPDSRTAPATWPFTHHLLAILDDPASRDEQGAVRISRVHELLRTSTTAETGVQSFTFAQGAADPAIVERPTFGEALSNSSGKTTPTIPDPRPTQPSLPAIEPLMDLADDARARGALPEALAGYKAALMVAPPGDTQVRASIYARIGELKMAQGKPREAELNFEKALAADPAHTTALDALVGLATGSKEVHRAIDLRRKRLGALAVPDERVAELRAIANIYVDQLQDVAAAGEALDQALAVDGKSRTALEGLRVANTKLQRWQALVEVLSRLAESAGDGIERSTLRFAAADVALGRLRDERLGLDLLERALDDDPTHEKALEALLAVRAFRGEWNSLEPVYLRLLNRFVAVGDTERAGDMFHRLGMLRRDHLHDATGALEALSGAVRCKPENADSRTLLAEMHLAVGAEVQAIAEFERLAQCSPARSSTYARLYGLHRRAGRTDKAWLAGSALAEVGSADMDQQLFVDQYRLDGPIRPSRSLDPAGCSDLLQAPGADDVVTDVLKAIVATAAAGRIDELRQARILVPLDPARRQSATSTVSAVRSFHWAAHVLGIEPPDLYVMDNVPGGIAAVHAATPTTALGPDVLRGLTTKDLAFLAGRHLTYYRPEHYSLICYPTLNDLSALFLGAVKVILPELDAPAHLRDAVLRTSTVLVKQATDQEKQRLGAAVERLEARGGRVDLAAWIRSVELSAARAGLLLCGDLAVSIARLRAEAGTRAIAELSFDEKRGDLLAFCVSEKLARARALMGVDAHASVSAPPPAQLQAS